MVLGGAAALAVGAVGVALAVVGATAWAAPVLAMAISLPALLVQDGWRTTAFRRAEPGAALASDLVFVAVQAGAFAALIVSDRLTTATAVLAWGAGATAGAVAGALMYRVWPGVRAGVELLRRQWHRARWLLADFSTGFIGDQLGGLAILFVLTEAEFGDYRAAWTFVGPVMVLYLAVGNLSLPEASRRLGLGGLAELRRFADRVSAVVTGLVLAYAAVLAVAVEPVARLVFSADSGFADVDSAALLLALGFLPSAVVYGRVHAVKVTGHAQRLWVPRLVVGLASVPLTVVLTGAWRVDGAAAAWPLSGLAFMVAVVLVAHAVLGDDTDTRRSRRREAPQGAPFGSSPGPARPGTVPASASAPSPPSVTAVPFPHQGPASFPREHP